MTTESYPEENADRKSRKPAHEPLEISIENSHLYNRAWLIKHIPGMHNHRLAELQKSFGLAHCNSGNRNGQFLFLGKDIIEALKREARAYRGIPEPPTVAGSLDFIAEQLRRIADALTGESSTQPPEACRCGHPLSSAFERNNP